MALKISKNSSTNYFSTMSVLLTTVVFISIVGLTSAQGTECIFHSDCSSSEMCYAGGCVFSGQQVKADTDLKLHLILPLAVGVPFVVLATILILTCSYDTYSLEKKHGIVINATTLESTTPMRVNMMPNPGPSVGQVNGGFGHSTIVVTPYVLTVQQPPSYSDSQNNIRKE